MSISAFNNIGFSTAASNTAGMNLSVSENNLKEKKESPKAEKKSFKIKEFSDKEKYYLGASILASSAIAGILIAKSRYKKGYEKLKDTNSIKGFIEKMDPEFDLNNKIESVFSKGYKRIDEVLYPAGINHSEFLTKDGKVIASVDWDLDNKVVGYVIKNEDGDVLKTFDI